MIAQGDQTPVVIDRVVVEGGGNPWVTWVPIVVGIAALALTAATFWWLNARKGKLQASIPRSCAMASQPEKYRFRVPLAIYNTGARSLVVGDLRCRFPAVGGIPDLKWISTRKTVRPLTDDFEDFLRPFAVAGRHAQSLIVEFGHDGPTTQLGPGVYQVVIEVADGMHPPEQERWNELVPFDLHVEDQEAPGAYIAYHVGPRPRS